MDDFVTRHEYMERIGRSDDKIANLDRRVTKLEDMGEKLSKMAVTMEGMLSSLQYMQAEQKEQGVRLKKIEEEPGDNWKKFMWTIFACAVTGVMGWILAKGGF